jgi:hypothetical protein
MPAMTGVAVAAPSSESAAAIGDRKRLIKLSLAVPSTLMRRQIPRSGKFAESNIFRACSATPKKHARKPAFLA